MGGYNAAGAVRTVMVPQISIVSDGDRRLMKVGPWAEVQSDGAMPEGYVTDAGVTPDITQAADLRGPAVITTIGTPSDPSGGLTLDPSTGDVFQSTGS